MTATAAMIARVRRMTDEPSATSDYEDADIQGYIEDHPLLDERGEEPYTWDTSSTPPEKEDNDSWVATYDLNLAAAEIWEEKAAVAAKDFTFSTDGGSYNRNEVYEAYMKNAAFYRSKRSAKTITQYPYPQEDSDYLEDSIRFN